MPTPLHVDPVLSYAHRDGASIRIQLVLADDPDLRPGGVTLRLVADDAVRRLRSTIERRDDRVVVAAEVPVAELDGATTWRLRLRPDGQVLRNLQTRLLVSDRQPVALLPGPAPKNEPVLPGTGTEARRSA